LVAALLAAGAFGLVGPAQPAAQARAGQATGSAQPTGLHVIPFPGTPDAATSSDIIFSSLHPSDIQSVTVTGSSSGPHAGTVRALPGPAGTAFVPSKQFTAGEQVSVTAKLTSASAGTASGAPGSTTLNFSFTVAVQTGRGGPGAPQPGSGPTRRFLSAPNLTPPVVTVSSDPDTSSGDIMVTPYHSVQGGPMILGPSGQILWFDPLSGWSANLEVQHYRGSPVLTFWHEASTGAVSEVLMDRHYRTVAVVHAADGTRADVHEFQVTPQGTALIDVIVPVRANLSSVGGSSSGIVADCVVQEINIKTGALLWDWHMLGHVPLNASYERVTNSTTPWGFCHLNSIQRLPDGDLLISARHTWGVYLVDKQTGKIIWTLGGKYSSFKIGPGANFAWQHDARLQGHVLTLFNDAWNGQHGTPEQGQASAKAISLDTSTMTATLVHNYLHTPPLVSASQGNAQLLHNGNMFVGWGSQPDFSEYSSGGQQIFTGSFPLGVQSYRAYRFSWQGQPLTRPSVALVPGPNGAVKVYASWNGATQVAAWRIVGGSSAHSMSQLGTSQRAAFETVRTVHSEPRYFGVQALNSSGHVLGASAAKSDPPHVAVFGDMSFTRSSTGVGAVAVGCFTGKTCHLTMRISSGGSVLAQHASHPLPSGRTTLIEYGLSPTAINRLNAAPNHRLPVQVSLTDSSGATATVNMNLIPYSVGATAVHRSVSQHNALQIVQNTGFVSASGTGHILVACYATAPCYVNTTVHAQGHQIAQQKNQYLGANEVAFITFRLDTSGRSMLRSASGNQLPAQITLTSGQVKATGQIPLVRYG
jgi:hypothetical protein